MDLDFKRWTLNEQTCNVHKTTLHKTIAHTVLMYHQPFQSEKRYKRYFVKLCLRRHLLAKQ